MNIHARIIPERQMLTCALEELERAHSEIARLIRVGNSNIELSKDKNIQSHDSSAGQDSGYNNQVRLTSPLAGLNALTFPMQEKNYDRAYIWALALQNRQQSNLAFLRKYRDLQTKRGEISETLRLSHAIAKIDKNTDAKAILRLEGRIREVSGWVPKISGYERRVDKPIPNRIMHLVKESRPHLSNGFTSRSHKNFLAEANAGLEPIVLTEPGFPRRLTSMKPSPVDVVDGVTHVRLDIGDIPYDDMPLDEYLSLFAQQAYEKVLQYRPSVIHASSGRRGYETALVGLALAEKAALPFVYEVRSFFEGNWTGDVEWESQGELFNRRMAVEFMCMQRADRVLTIGQAMKDELVSRGIPKEKIGIIPNAVDTEAFEPRERNSHLAEKYGLTGIPTFGYVSNMDHYRESQETLVHACKILKARGSEARCVLVGSGPRMSLLQDLANSLDIGERIIFTGSVDHFDIPDYYSLIDIFVVPRVAERAATYVTPLKPFEAMALQKPIVVSNLPALTEIVSPPHRGEIFSPGNSEELADVLQVLFDDANRAKRLGLAGYEWVTSNRTWDMNGQRYVQEFNNLNIGGE